MPPAFPRVQPANTQARRERTTMATTTTEPTVLIAFSLPSTPYSVQIARFYVKAALTYHNLGQYTDTAQTVASELATNAITHADGQTFSLGLLRLEDPDGISVVVTDDSPRPPALRAPADDFEHWRGLNIIAALATRWGWTPHQPGKAVYAILTAEG
jgi:anti-sigma regulatory factor (Ser/Thr protein kinase)